MTRPRTQFVLVQLSDPHVGADWAPADAAARLAAAVAAVQGMPARPDAVLVSGDLADHADAAEYEQVVELLSPLGAPLYVLPGNHDDRAALRRHFDVPGIAGGPVRYSVDLGPVRLVVLDTTIPGRDDGALEAGQLDWLDSELATGPGTPTILAMHHPPVKTGIPSCDDSGLRRAHAEALAEVVARHPRVQTVTAGHVHRAVTGRLAGRPVVVAPSTYVQIGLRLGREGLELAGDEPAGFLVHALVDGEVVSYVQQVV